MKYVLLALSCSGALIAADNDDADAAAQRFFDRTCALCHGATGAGDGMLAGGLEVRPRSLRSTTWQDSVSDEHIRRVIVDGGPAVGLSSAMPAHAQLADQPAVADALVRLIRAMRQPDTEQDEATTP